MSCLLPRRVKMIEALLAIPSAITAIKEISGYLRKDNQSSQQLSQLDIMEASIQQIVNAFTGLDSFSKRVRAWKQVHHITNRLETDMHNTFPYILSNNETNFVERICSDAKFAAIIEQEIKAAKNRKRSSMAELRLFIAEPDLCKQTISAEGFKLDGVWYDKMIQLMDSSSELLDMKQFSTLYKKLCEIARLSMDLNNLADEIIKKDYENLVKIMDSVICKLPRY